MIKIIGDKYENPIVKVKVSFEIEVPFEDNEIGDEVSKEDVLNGALEQLDYLACSNDGSEKIGNIGADGIEIIS